MVLKETVMVVFLISLLYYCCLKEGVREIRRWISQRNLPGHFMTLPQKSLFEEFEPHYFTSS
jgi:hypothetical protein